jgi:hypothetical protein
MADILLDEQSSPTTPSSGKGVIFIDSTASILCFKDDSGVVKARSTNASIAAQTVNAADTYLTNSDILIPSFGLQAKTSFLFMISASKTGAGTAQPIYNIRIGANRSTADTARLTLTGPLQTAIADIGTLYVLLTVRSVGGAGVIQGTAWWSHRGTAASTTVSGTGFANDSTGHIEGSSAGFDMTALGGQYIGLSVNSGGSGVWTVTQVQTEADW